MFKSSSRRFPRAVTRAHVHMFLQKFYHLSLHSMVNAVGSLGVAIPETLRSANAENKSFMSSFICELPANAHWHVSIKSQGLPSYPCDNQETAIMGCTGVFSCKVTSRYAPATGTAKNYFSPHDIPPMLPLLPLP